MSSVRRDLLNDNEVISEIQVEAGLPDVLRIALPYHVSHDWPKAHQQEYIELQYRKKTSIDEVGLQLWRGSFLLADFILHLSKTDLRLFQGETVLEIGSGIGFVASLCASKAVGCANVIATDIQNKSVLELLSQNLLLNRRLSDPGTRALTLDFDLGLEDHPLLTGLYSEKYPQWTKEWIKLFEQNCATLLAADIIYEDTLSFKFISSLQKLLRNGKTLYLSLEKRIRFTFVHLEECAPAFEYFIQTLEAFNAQNSSQLIANSVDVSSLPQYFSYQRLKELELWKIHLT
jgi:predicted nicotinamide N-methyase